MAGMDLNPYNLNNRRSGIRGDDAVRKFNEHYARTNTYDMEEEEKERKEKEEKEKEEKEKEEARKKYMNHYGFKNTDPKNMDLSKQIKSENDYTLYFIGFGILILIFILLVVFI